MMILAKILFDQARRISEKARLDGLAVKYNITRSDWEAMNDTQQLRSGDIIVLPFDEFVKDFNSHPELYTLGRYYADVCIPRMVGRTKTTYGCTILFTYEDAIRYTEWKDRITSPTSENEKLDRYRTYLSNYSATQE